MAEAQTLAAKDKHEIIYGIAPGIRFATLLDGRGGCSDLTVEQLREWKPGHGVLWVHTERDDNSCREWLSTGSGLDPMITEALLAEESRPRIETYEDALMVVLRGVNHNDRETPEDLVPIHVWVDQDRIISLRDKDTPIWALRQIREALVGGHGPRTVGGLFARIAAQIMQHLEPLVDEIEDDIDDLDEKIADTPRSEARRTLSEIRRHATKLRRWLAPQREAMYRLQNEELSWLGQREKIQLREVTDRLLRYMESLDAVRDRATILHDDLTSLISEQIGRNSYRLTAVAAVLLPPTLVTGIFGQNLGGLWGGQHPWAFTIGVGAEVLMMPLVWLLLRRAGWL